MNDNIPSYRDALENVMKWVSAQVKEHPDPEQREQAGRLLGDWVLATIMQITEGHKDSGDRTNVVDLPTGREPRS